MTHAGVINPCVSRDSSTTDVPFALQPDPSCPGADRTARTLSTRGAPTPQLPRLRHAFHLSILVIRSSLALRTTLQTIISTRVLPPWPDIRHAFTHRLCVLGTPRNDYSPGREGHMPSIGFCNLNDLRTHPRGRQTPASNSKLLSAR
jgi:hypothetical protein